ncbi:hypothetical protein [Ruminiclostridium josui]|uniref:hypothetical protein n=1 Tax=Ruminiclostridium josui TaxID=1499 RepID=UPI0004643620|nr:hypothetical protein [Ruminiclostridium josui]
MKRKFLVIFMLLCFIISSTGCFNKENQEKVSSYHTKDAKQEQYSLCNEKADLTQVKMGDKDEIVSRTGVLPSNLRIVGARDEKNIYCCDEDNKNVYLYNVDKKTKSVVSSTVNPKKYLNTVSVNDKWIVWVEDDVKVETDALYDINWRAYARNLKTSEIIQFDKDKGIKVDPSAVYVKVEPYEFSLFGDKVVYESYDKLNNTTCAVIKMYDLSKKSVEIIDSNKDYSDGFYSHPKIYNNLISWSESKCSADWSEKGSTYIYNINTKEKHLITTGTDILWPYIYGNFIAARVKPNGQNTDSSIVLYDLNKKDGWHTIASPKSYDYKDENYVEMLMPSIYGAYLIWQDNIRAKILVYNCKNNKMYSLAQKVGNDDTVACIGIYNNVLFWYENHGKYTVHKYAVLK